MSHTAIVTGGTRGIGAAISVALSEEGHKVAATYAGNDEAAEAFKTPHRIARNRQVMGGSLLQLRECRRSGSGVGDFSIVLIFSQSVIKIRTIRL